MKKKPTILYKTVDIKQISKCFQALDIYGFYVRLTWNLLHNGGKICYTYVVETKVQLSYF